MRIVLSISALFGLCLLPSEVDATGCRVIVRHQAVVHQQAYVAPYVAALVQPYQPTAYIATPTYHIAYGSENGLSKEIFEAYKQANEDRLRLALQLGQQAGNGGAGPLKAFGATTKPVAQHAVFSQKNCIACHSDAPKGKDNAYSMFKGGVYQEPDDNAAAELIRRVTLPVSDPKHMPPGKQLDPGELMAFINSVITGGEALSVQPNKK